MPQPHRRPQTSRPPAAPRSPHRRVAAGTLAAVALAAVAACADAPIAGPSAARAADPQARAAAAEHRDLATLRAATARFHRLGVADGAGYTVLFLNTCMADGSAASRGAMGEHYVNPLLLDGTVDVATPEALLYEPGPNGQRRLVGVEYVIPAGDWAGDAPPRLFGRDFTLNGFGLWALHVWVWKHNPSGMYADWNPRVSCADAPAAPAAARAAHH